MTSRDLSVTLTVFVIFGVNRHRHTKLVGNGVIIDIECTLGKL